MDAIKQEVPDTCREAFRAFADTVPSIIWTATADGTITFFNREFYRFFGIDHMRWGDLQHPDDKALSQKAWAESITTGAPLRRVSRYMAGDGEYHYLVTQANPVRNPDGTVGAWIGSSAVVQSTAASRPALRIVA